MGAIRPVVIVGCGGSGAKVVQMVRASLLSRLRRAGLPAELPEAWQLVIIDSPKSQEADVPGVARVDDLDYHSIGTTFIEYRDVVDSLINVTVGDNTAMYGRLAGWLPEASVGVPLEVGAGRMRAIGRAMATTRNVEVRGFLDSVVARSKSGQTELVNLAKRMSVDAVAASATPVTFVVSSLAGGTGAGIFMDVCDHLRTIDPKLNTSIKAVLFTAEVFQEVEQDSGFQPNTLAAISELMSGYFTTDRLREPLYNVGASTVGSSGPTMPFLVGMSPMGAHGQLESVMDCYRAVTETLAVSIWDPEVSAQFSQFDQGNWLENQRAHHVSWNFGNDGDLKSVVSALGSSRLSIGLERFEEYALCRLTRSVVDFQIHGWASRWEQVMGTDPQQQNEAQSTISPEDLVRYVVTIKGREFLEACGLEELDVFDPDGKLVPNDQIIEAICSEDRLKRAFTIWRSDVSDEIMQTPSYAAADLHETVVNFVPQRRSKFETAIAGVISDGTSEFVASTPARVLGVVSRAISDYGLRPTIGLLEFTDSQLSSAAEQLRSQASEFKTKSQDWRTRVGAEFSTVGGKVDTSSDAGRALVAGAVQQAGAPAYYGGFALVRERGAVVIDELRSEFLSPLLAQLRQIGSSLAGSDAGLKQVQDWPTDAGVPESFRPPPLEFCLIPAGEWPERFRGMKNDTRGDDSTHRAEIGGGGFVYTEGAIDHEVPPSISIKVGKGWQPRVTGHDGGLVEFEAAMEVDDIHDRATRWFNRSGTPFGEFTSQGLRDYLAPTQNGRPVTDHNDRLARLRTQLADAVAAASPLVSIDQRYVTKVHRSTGIDALAVSLIAQKLPFVDSSDCPAYDLAVDVLTTALRDKDIALSDATLADYFTASEAAAKSESVSYVARLAGAVHPATVTSLMKPIATEWRTTMARGPAAITDFWGRRRARPLMEFIPTSPRVMKAMVAGFVWASILERMPKPANAAAGFTIQDEIGRHLAFPNPLLTQPAVNVDQKTRWIAWILESLPLAMAMFASDGGDSMDAYDALYRLGRHPDEIPEELRTHLDGSLPLELRSTADSETEVERLQAVIGHAGRIHSSFERAAADHQFESMERAWEVRSGFELFDMTTEVLKSHVMRPLEERLHITLEEDW